MHALYRPGALVPTDVPEDEWALILPRMKLGPHRQHFFQLERHAVEGKSYTHVRITIYPDGGIKRVRVLGHRAAGATSQPVANELTAIVPGRVQEAPLSPSRSGQTGAHPTIPALPLTIEAFMPFGKVVQAYTDVSAVPNPRHTRITGANQGTATKFHKLALLESSYPEHIRASATTGLSVYRCRPIDVQPGGEWEVKLLERHPCTNQAFIPMGGTISGTAGTDALEDPGTRYLVIVAKNGPDDRPELASMRAFIASAGQAVVYETGVWREYRVFGCCPIDLRDKC